MDAIDYLASSNYIMVNRGLMMAIGLNESIILGELASEYRYWRDQKKLKDGEWFYSTDNNLVERLPFSAPTIRRAIEKLKGLGILETKITGVPAKRYFRIVPDKIPGCSNFTNLECSNFTTNKIEEEKRNEESIIGGRGSQDSDSEQSVLAPRMKPSALRQELARIFKASDPSKTQSNQSVAKLQSRIDDDSLIIKAAKKMKNQDPIEIKGRIWKPDYFWFVNPEKTDIVSKRIIEAVKSELTEEDIPEGLREQYDVAISLGAAEDYTDCKENWGMILPKIIMTPEYKELTNGR